MLSRRVLLFAATATLAGPARAAHALKKPVGKAAAPKMAAAAPGEAATPSTPAETPVGPVDTAARWAIVVDYNTGATLLDKDADVSMPPSSMTKLMTAYIVYGLLKAGRLTLNQELPVSERAWRMGGSKMFVQIGTQVRIEDLIRGMIVQSGNDACIVLAEGIAGSVENFVDLMNQKAKELGLTDSVFRNPTGWPDPEHHMSARDIATLARRIIQDFPEYYKYDLEKTFKYNNIEQENRNPLVQKGLADGLKTGHTEEGGYGLVVSAQRNGRRVIIVLNGMGTMHQRAEESERLLEWTFREFEDVTLFTAGDTVEQAPVWLGAEPTVPLVGGRELQVTMPRNWRNKARIAIEYQSPIPSPVVRGTTLGKLTVSGEGVPDMSIPLLAGADVPRLGLPGRALAVFSHYVTGGSIAASPRGRHLRRQSGTGFAKMIAGRSGCRLLALAVLLASGFVGAAAPAPDADPLTGKLLVASPDIGDPRFRHAVILLVRHGEGGAFGIIVNHPIGAWSWERLMAAVGRNGAGLAGTVRVFAGGPVEPTSGFVLHSPDYRRDATMAIDGSVAMTSSVGILRDIAGHAGPQKCLVAFGYAGWGPGQLDRELALHAWFAIADDPKLVFDDDRAKIWDEAMARRTIAL